MIIVSSRRIAASVVQAVTILLSLWSVVGALELVVPESFPGKREVTRTSSGLMEKLLGRVRRNAEKIFGRHWWRV
jgi:hypothetical protein